MADSKKVKRRAFHELLVHGLKYFLPAQLGAPARGIPTAWAAPPIEGMVTGVRLDSLGEVVLELDTGDDLRFKDVARVTAGDTV